MYIYSVCVYTYTHTHTHKYTHIQTHTHAHGHTHTHMCKYTSIYVYIYICLHIYIHVYMYVASRCYVQRQLEQLIWTCVYCKSLALHASILCYTVTFCHQNKITSSRKTTHLWCNTWYRVNSRKDWNEPIIELVGSYWNVMMIVCMQETCGQRSKMASGSKRWAFFFPNRIFYMLKQEMGFC